QCFRMLYDALEYRSSRDIALTIHRGGTTKSCRGLVCWCDCGQAIAVTLRDHGRSDGPARQVTLPMLKDYKDHAPKYLASLLQCDLGPRPPKGLLVVCGETGSGKSKVADGLLRHLLKDHLKPN